MNRVDASLIGAHTREFSRLPHIAGSPRNNQLGKMTAQMYRDYGFDEVREMTFPVLLTNLTHRSVNVTNADGSAVTYTCSLEEENVVNQEGWAQALPPSNGYSGSGKVQGQIVWANWGRDEDFKTLDAMGIDLTGKIVVARYGKIFRGNKARLAQDRGAAGVLIVHDAGIVGPGIGPGQTPGYPRPVFPNGPWATNTTVQRGSIYLGEGDPRTPHWPSQFGGPVLSQAEVFDDATMQGNALPKIPVQPLGYGDASHVLRNLGGGHALPDEWKDTGFLKELLAGGIGPSNNSLVQLEVRRDLQVFNVTHVSAEIRGSIEPDRVVLLGSHLDAWTYGAVDPISGHSTITEIARVLGLLVKNEGWRPRRSIQVNSWDCEEWMISSSEYVEANLELLKQRAVAYLNLDTAVQGNDTLECSGSPLLRDIYMEAANEVFVPGTSSSSSIGSSDQPNQVPVASLISGYEAPGSGSDHVGFIQLAGIPVLDASFSSSQGIYEAVYHSNYDSSYWIEHFADPGYKFHAAMAQLYGNIAIRLADTNLLPMNTSQYAASVEGWVDDYIKENDPSPGSTTPYKVAGIDWSFMKQCVDKFRVGAQNHVAAIARLQSQISSPSGTIFTVNPYLLRSINDRSMGVERVFIASGKNETGQIWYKHVLYTPSAVNSYGSTLMPIIALGLLTGDRAQAQFAIGRVGQFICQAGEYLNQTGVLPPLTPLN